MSPVHALPRSLLVCGVVRDCARTIAKDLARLREATAWVSKLQCLVVESDSDDATMAVLQQLAAAWPGLQVVTLGRLRERLPERTDRIAHARNTCLELLERDARYADVDHVLMADLDGMCTDLCADALRSCWQLDVPWSVCTANQGDCYYDIWALRHPQWCPGDTGVEQAALAPLMGKSAAKNLALLARMVHISPDTPPIEVDSAFGGLAIYRRAAVEGLRYDSRDAEGRPACEHVALHLAMRSRGERIFINPRLINAKRTWHARRKGFWRTLRRQMWNGLRGRGWG